MAVARGERPELSARALEQAAHLIALLRAVLADRWYPSDGVHMPGFRPDSGVDKEAGEHLPPLSTMNGARSTGTRPNGAPRVQHIPVRKVGVREAGEP